MISLPTQVRIYSVRPTIEDCIVILSAEDCTAIPCSEDCFMMRLFVTSISRNVLPYTFDLSISLSHFT